MSIIIALKNRLLKAGPKSRLLLQSFRIQAALNRISMRVADNRICLARANREVILGIRDVISVPFVVHEWDQFFQTLEGQQHDGRTTLDFSKPGLHRYRKCGLSFYAPSLAEDDSMDAYTAAYAPRLGDVDRCRGPRRPDILLPCSDGRAHGQGLRL